MSFLKRIFAIAQAKLDRYVFITLLFFAASIAVWFFSKRLVYRTFAPFADPDIRFWTALALLAAGLAMTVWLLVGVWRRRRAEERAAAKREPTPVEAACAEFDASFSAATAVIQDRWTAEGGKLYGAPWIMALGVSGAGKSSLLDNADLRFPIDLALSNALAGRQGEGAEAVGWRVANEAVILDLDGRLLTAEADSVKGALWTRLLERLKRHRPRMPLNALVVVLDFHELAAMGADQRAALAATLRGRTQELIETLGVRPALYVAFTKLDRIAGFLEFFDHLTPAERERPLGLHFTLEGAEKGAWLEEFRKGYAEMAQRMDEAALLRIRDLRETRTRREAYFFTRQMAGLIEGLSAFLADAFGSDRYSAAPLMRGVYFLSSRQENAPRNIFMDAAARRYGVPPPIYPAPAAAPRPYFATRLFQEAIFPELGLAPENQRLLRRRTGVGLAAMTAAAAACLGAGLYWFSQYDWNLKRAGVVLEKSRSFSALDRVAAKDDATGAAFLTPLNEIREATMAFGDYRAVGTAAAAISLYQGKTIGPVAEKSYVGMLKDAFGPALTEGVRRNLEKACPKGGQKALDLLRVYLLMGEGARAEGQKEGAGRKPEDIQAIEGYFKELWRARFEGDKPRQDNLAEHLSYLLSSQTDYKAALDPALIAQIRRDLQKVSAYQRLYQGFETRAARVLSNPVDLRSTIGPQYPLIYQEMKASDAVAGAASAAVPPDADGCPPEATPAAGGARALEVGRVFTRPQFFDYFIPESMKIAEKAHDDLWSLGERARTTPSAADIAHARTEFSKLYAEAYETSWRGALNQLKLRPFASLKDAVETLGAMSGPDRPLQRLVDVVSDNTQIYAAAPTAASPGAKPAADAKAAPGSVVAPAASAALPEAAAVEYRETGLAIGRAFAALNRLRAPEGSDTAPNLDGIRAALVAAHDYARDINDAPPEAQMALRRAVERISLKGDDPLYVLERVANAAPPPLDTHLRDAARQTWRMIMLKAAQDLERSWREKVYGGFMTQLGGKYPFEPTSAEDAPEKEFVAFFQPGGVFDAFLKTDLSPFFNLQTGEPLRVDGEILPVSPAFAKAVRDGMEITRLFFREGGLSYEYEIAPVLLSGGLSGATLIVEGQVLQYQGGPSYPRKVIWPNAVKRAGYSRLSIAGAGGGASAAAIAKEGPWSWLRLYDAGEKSNFTADTVDVEHSAGDGRRVVFRYRVSGASNPFFRSPLRGFRPPASINEGGPAAQGETP